MAKSHQFIVASKSTLDELLRSFGGAKVIALDTETSDLDPHTARLWSIQISDGKKSVLIPMTTERFTKSQFRKLESLLSSADTVLMHRATFDLKILWKAGITLHSNNVWCTRTAEQVLTAGRFSDTSLAGTVRRHLGITLSKAERKDFYDGTFEASQEWTPELINYALSDVRYLHGVYAAQFKQAEREGLLHLMYEIEQPLVQVTALLEYRGVNVDEAGLAIFQEDMRRQAEAAKAEIISELDKHYQIVARKRYAKNLKAWGEWKAATEELKNAEKNERSSAQSRTKESLATLKAHFDAETKRTWVARWPDVPLGRHDDKLTRAQLQYRNGRKAVWNGVEAEHHENYLGVSQNFRETYKEQRHLLVKPFPNEPKPPKQVNLRSTQQVTAALAHAGVSLPNLRKETLQDAAGEHDLLDKFLEFRKYEKLAQFAEITEKINRATGRLHTEYNQNVDTGRYSSKQPNLQNIPARTDEGKRFRSLFVARKGERLVGADFSAIELVIIGVLSGDEKLLKAINEYTDDPHTYTMSQFLGASYDSLFAARKGKATREQSREAQLARDKFDAAFNLPDLKEVENLTEWVSKLRDYVKTLTYGIAYGLSPYGLARKFHCSPETAQQFIDTFFGVYGTIKVWLDATAKTGLRRSYSETVAGRRRYYRKVRQPSDEEVRQKAEEKLRKEERDLESVSEKEWSELLDEEYRDANREYRQLRNRILRQAANHPIQGTSADITKLAMVFFEQWLATLDVDRYRYGLVLTVHDELIALMPESHAETAADVLRKAMEEAARTYLGESAKIVVTPKVTQHWEK